ncbi:MAG: hypothetical protein ACI9OJ_003325 [Myxococcota bacterium]|jgi:hypothetical protein
MSRFCALMFLGTALILLGPACGSATTIRSMSTFEMVAESAVIIRGTVEAQRGLFNADMSRIYTDSTVLVTRVIAGKGVGSTTRSKRISVRQIGGRVGEVSMTVPGVARLAPGEDVVLFLRTDGTRHYLVGMSQGKFSLRKGPKGQTLVGRDLSGLHFLRSRGKPFGHPPVTAPPETFNALVERIRTAGGLR